MPVSRRLSNVEKELAQLNETLREIETNRAEVRKLQSRVTQLRDELTVVQQSSEATSTNNLTISWDGPTLKLTWTAGYVKDQFNKVYAITAGERTGLTASTYYWLGWNPVHQTMSVVEDLSQLTAIPNIKVVSRVFTGTGAQAGTAGGGGSEPGGVDVSASKYKLF